MPAPESVLQLLFKVLFVLILGGGIVWNALWLHWGTKWFKFKKINLKFAYIIAILWNAISITLGLLLLFKGRNLFDPLDTFVFPLGKATIILQDWWRLLGVPFNEPIFFILLTHINLFVALPLLIKKFYGEKVNNILKVSIVVWLSEAIGVFLIFISFLILAFPLQT